LVIERSPPVRQTTSTAMSPRRATRRYWIRGRRCARP